MWKFNRLDDVMQVKCLNNQPRLMGRFTPPFSTKIGYIWDSLGWRFSSARLRMANDTVTAWRRCLLVQGRAKMGKYRKRFI